MFVRVFLRACVSGRLCEWRCLEGVGEMELSNASVCIGEKNEIKRSPGTTLRPCFQKSPPACVTRARPRRRISSCVQAHDGKQVPYELRRIWRIVCGATGHPGTQHVSINRRVSAPATPTQKRAGMTHARARARAHCGHEYTGWASVRCLPLSRGTSHHAAALTLLFIASSVSSWLAIAWLRHCCMPALAHTVPVARACRSAHE